MNITPAVAELVERLAALDGPALRAALVEYLVEAPALDQAVEVAGHRRRDPAGGTGAGVSSSYGTQVRIVAQP